MTSACGVCDLRNRALIDAIYASLQKQIRQPNGSAVAVTGTDGSRMWTAAGRHEHAQKVFLPLLSADWLGLFLLSGPLLVVMPGFRNRN